MLNFKLDPLRNLSLNISSLDFKWNEKLRRSEVRGSRKGGYLGGNLKSELNWGRRNKKTAKSLKGCTKKNIESRFHIWNLQRSIHFPQLLFCFHDNVWDDGKYFFLLCHASECTDAQLKSIFNPFSAFVFQSCRMYGRGLLRRRTQGISDKIIRIF